jgi:hypothetical protein
VPRELHRELATLIGRRLREACVEDIKPGLPFSIAEKLDELRAIEEAEEPPADGHIAQVAQLAADATL